MEDLFKGKLVCLSGIDPEELGKNFSRWGRDSEFKRLLDFDPARLHSTKATREWMEKHMEAEKDTFWFSIRTLGEDRLLGDIDLSVINWGSRDAFVGLGIGERDFWGKGYGTDAMKLVLRYAFLELNLRRVTLNVFEYNERAIRSYEKAGFRLEGSQRQAIQREGRRWDMVYMGILREEWMEHNQNAPSAVEDGG
jgi:RimJ/RimL family protein N-acetyltransferase